MKITEENRQQFAQYVKDVDAASEKLANALDGFTPLAGYTALVNVAALALFDAKGPVRKGMAKLMRDVLKKEAEDAAA